MSNLGRLIYDGGIDDIRILRKRMLKILSDETDSEQRQQQQIQESQQNQRQRQQRQQYQRQILQENPPYEEMTPELKEKIMSLFYSNEAMWWFEFERLEPIFDEVIEVINDEIDERYCAWQSLSTDIGICSRFCNPEGSMEIFRFYKAFTTFG